MLQGKFIGVAEDVNTFVLEHTICIKKPSAAVLRATALGIYFVQINGVRVGDSYLTPGWTAYHKMLQVQEYDVTAFLKEGENVISFTVNEGWYAGPLFWLMKRNCYGEKIAVCADLVFDGETISTDERWTARTSYIREAGIYGGETADFTAECSSLTAQEIVFDKAVLVKQICEPVRTVERLPVKEVIRTPKGDLVYDFGQNIAGVAEIVTPEGFEGTLTMRFAELLVDGEFYTANLGNAKATDTLTCKGRVTYSPEFTFHGFRYMKLSGGELPKECVTALVRHTDMRRTGNIHTSCGRIQKLLDNIVWSQRDNFVDIPTDCPQRSERLGWTGDINAFCTTAAYNYDIRAFMKKWLADVRNEQAETGEIPVVVPYVIETIGKEMTLNTSAMWSDCIVTIPYKLYELYGDESFLSENYTSMKRFVAAREKIMKKGLIVSGFEFGDWLSMDVDPYVRFAEFGATDKYLIANFLHLNVLNIMTKTATVLKRNEDSLQYRAIYENTLAAVRKEYFTSGGRIASDSITAHVLALYFHIVPEEFRAKTAAALNQKVEKHGYRVVTGFIGTPYLLFALADNGYAETAGKVLMNRACPGWLYEVDMGATTVWERWNTIRPDGKPNSDGMNSCNHYAYGSVMEYFYRRIAGIEPTAPGFKSVKIAPVPCKGLPRVCASFDSVSGKIEAGYEQNKRGVTFFAQVPDGVFAELVIPGEGKVAEGNGRLEYTCEWDNLDVPAFGLESTVQEIFANPRASQAFNCVFSTVFHPLELDYLKNSSDTLEFARKYLADKGKLGVKDFDACLEQFNKIYDYKESL